MKNIFIERTRRTPEISLNINGMISISGMSIPENPSEFYQPALSWLDQFKMLEPVSVVIKVHLAYINTSSMYIVLKFLKKAVSIPSAKDLTKITWIHDADDDDMIEQGNIMQRLVGVPFIFEEVEAV
ncbi:MAG: DUF1987 domain-containing protein [Bacteroidia bacterium]